MWPHWDAQLDPPGDDHMGYFEPQWDPATRWTKEPNAKGNTLTIKEVNLGIMNQHPELVSLLADEWQRAYDFLDTIGTELTKVSVALHDEAWGDGEARNAFMKFGPGKTLVYLDQWMDAVHNNVDGLRQLAPVLVTVRDRMSQMWDEYQADLKAAAQPPFEYGSNAWILSHTDPSNNFAPDPDANARDQAAEREAVDKVDSEYNLSAQKLAYELAGHYVDLYKKIGYGYGFAFDPPNAVLPDEIVMPSPPMPPMPPARPPTPPTPPQPPPVPTPPVPPVPDQLPVPPVPDSYRSHQCRPVCRPTCHPRARGPARADTVLLPLPGS